MGCEALASKCWCHFWLSWRCSRTLCQLSALLELQNLAEQEELTGTQSTLRMSYEGDTRHKITILPRKGTPKGKWSNRSADVVRTLHNRPCKETADSGCCFQTARGNWEWRSQERKQQLVLQLHLHFSITKPTKRRLNFKEWFSYVKEWKAAWNWKKMENKTRNVAGDTPTSPLQKNLSAVSTSLQKAQHHLFSLISI